MVENFTKIKEDTYTTEDKDLTNYQDDVFEIKLKSNLQNLSKNPNRKTIESILAYSKSLKKD
ncbi:hypothetical protein [Sphingobacterium spiritivorum]|uniref:Uncharacterized protein n=1 Tax=Sphingobacterium spiritivorum ATCC 33861 TaxID=525373 RepID=D7VHC9_SPHSI|nr:hypothetical protein [Sphingobacterium spiritivorum]EFK59481.1 hypothetical protein HMPREF0766_10398 [Sphingobacterium spiritivorum ATCC 33861]QQT33840.1 hypothetical protein I6J01_10765 [Sphingobacterium spiritivorum]WQD34658.1 hypothetical protein U0038_02700 [Sphingobacterium spiritivorum]SUI97655.1 Uncharacterised protein [Sphingobacterium spiritivorum]